MTTLTPLSVRDGVPRPGRVREALRAAANERSRWPFLDGARGIAIIGVFGFHALRIIGEWYSPKIRGAGVPEYLWATGLARFAIDMFFVLSGFLVATTWWTRRKRHERLGPALREYARGRAFRILPVFWLSVLIFVPLRAPELLSSAKHLLLLATSQQYLDPDLPERFNVVTWSLTVETHFYVLLPLMAVLARRRTTALVLLAGTIALTVWWYGARGDWPSSFTLGRLDQFAVGMVVADLYRRFSEGERPWPVRIATARGVGWLLGAALVAVGVYHGVELGLPRGHWFDAWQHPVAGLAMGGLGLRMLCSPRRLLLVRMLEWRALLVLGAMSYSLYLWHIPILEWVHDHLSINDMVPVLGSALVVVVAAVLSFAASALSYALVEVPFMRRKTKQREEPEAREPRPEPVAARA